MTAPDPLPTEDEADRFFTEVLPALSEAPAAPRSPGTASAASTTQAAPGATTAPGRRLARVVAVLVVLVPLTAVVTSALRGTPVAPRTVATAATIPADFFGGRPCVHELPPTTDGRFIEVSCEDGAASAVVRGVTVLTTPDDVYPDPAELDRLARALCHLDFGYGIPGARDDVLVSVPSETSWYARGSRYVVCAEPVP